MAIPNITIPNTETLAMPVAPVPPSRSVTISALYTIGGPVLLGAVIGLPFGAQTMLYQAVSLPAVLLGITLLMAPALYIGLTLVGVAPPARRVVAALLEGLRVCGVVFVGLCPATAFILATATTATPALLLGTAVVAGGTIAGLRASFAQLLAGVPLVRAVPLVALWTTVSLGLGAHLFIGSLISEVF